MTFEAYRFPSGNVLGVKGGCQRRSMIVIERNFRIPSENKHVYHFSLFFPYVAFILCSSIYNIRDFFSFNCFNFDQVSKILFVSPVIFIKTISLCPYWSITFTGYTGFELVKSEGYVFEPGFGFNDGKLSQMNLTSR